MADLARVQKVNITGTDVDKLLKLDVSTHTNGGSVGFQDTNTSPVNSIDDAVTIQGIKGIVSKTGTMASRSGIGSIVSADLGNKAAKKSISLIKPIDDATFKPYYMADVVAALPNITVDFQSYNLLIEEYFFAGRTIDCLNDLAGLVYGKVIFDSAKDKYVIVGGDTTYSSKSGGGSFTVDSNNLISWENVLEKDQTVLSFGSNLIAVAKELAKLRAAILDIKITPTTTVETKELKDRISFSFGFKGGPVPIPEDLWIDSINWDYWYYGYEGVNVPYLDANSSIAFVPKQSKYYFVEILKESVTTPGPDGGPGTTTRGYVRGLRSIGVGTTLWYRLKNISSGDTILGKGYVSNLVSLGAPSVTKYKESVSASTGSESPFDDVYNVLYNVKLKEIKVREPNSPLVSITYVPYIGFNLSPALYNQIQTSLKAKNGVDPTEIEINENLMMHKYEAKIEICGVATSLTGLKYRGALDKYGRLISDSGQVVLILVNNYFYGPLEGMDMSFDTAIIDPVSSNSNFSFSTLLNDFFDESGLKTDLAAAYLDLKLLCAAQVPIGTYGTNANTTTMPYPRFINEVFVDLNGNITGTGGPIGIEYETCAALSNKVPNMPLTLTNYTSNDKLRKQLKRKLQCIESKVSLIIKCIKKIDPSTNVDTQTVKALLKVIIAYNTLLNRVKNESINVMVSKRAEYEKALNLILTQYNGDTTAKIRRATVNIILPDVLPSIGDSMSVPTSVGTGPYKVANVTVSGVTATVVGEYNV